jgi:hypothetical protein
VRALAGGIWFVQALTGGIRFVQALALGVVGALALAACGGSSSSSSAATSSATTSAATSSAATSSAAPAAATSTSTDSASSSAATQIGFEGVPLEQGSALGSPGTTRTGNVDGIRCGPTEQLAYHIHAHLAVYVNGRLYALPAGVGIPGSVVQPTPQGPEAAGGRCIYWLHTHTTDGVIHIESPTRRIYTLGNFFDEWHQPLGATHVAGVRGRITAFLNGKPWKKSLRAIPLLPHADIQFDIGEPAPPLLTVDWSQTRL